MNLPIEAWKGGGREKTNLVKRFPDGCCAVEPSRRRRREVWMGLGLRGEESARQET